MKIQFDELCFHTSDVLNHDFLRAVYFLSVPSVYDMSDEAKAKLKLKLQK